MAKVGEPAQENGVQGEAAAPSRRTPTLPAPPGCRTSPASPQAGPKPRASRPPLPPPRARMPVSRGRSPWAEPAGGGGSLWSGAEAACLRPALFFRERVWSGLWGSIVFINTRRGLYLKLGLGQPRPSCPSARLPHSSFALPSRLPEVVSFSDCILHAAQ